MKATYESSASDCSGCDTDDECAGEQAHAVEEEKREKEHRKCHCHAPPPRCDFLAAGLGPDGEPVEGGTPESIALARVELSNGNVIEFVGVRNPNEGDEIGVRELGGGLQESAPTFPFYSTLSVLEMYVKLVPDGSPIPKMIAESDENADKKLRDRYEWVEFVEQPIAVDLDERELKSVETDSHYCAGGFNSFKNDFCDSASFPSNTWWWCDPEANFHWRDRWTTNHKRRNSLGITAACTGPAATQHYYKNIWGNWKHNKTWHLPAGYWHWTKWNGGSQRDRWIRHRSIVSGGSSFLRCVSFFWT